MGFGNVHRRETAQKQTGNYDAAAAHPKPRVGQILDSVTPKVNATVAKLRLSRLTSGSPRKRKRDMLMTGSSGDDRAMPYCGIPSSLFHESAYQPYLPCMIDIVKRHPVQHAHQLFR